MVRKPNQILTDQNLIVIFTGYYYKYNIHTHVE
uniref:Uncharacterized protein n=1 Tax=viral metagenome TaxID=1070528 RepID=A0A6C0BM08_9ZZZZ